MDNHKKQAPRGLELPPWCLDEIQKGKVANKVLAGEKLNNDEKRLVFKSLTGIEPPWKKKGRPKNTDRDMAIAFEYLLTWSEGRHRPKIGKLKEKHDMQGHSKNAFSMACKRGLKEWKDLLVAAQKEIYVADGFASFFLETIERYEQTPDNPINSEKIN